MAHFNRDSIIAVVLLAFCGVMFSATFAIEPLKFDSTVGPEFWPRIAIGSLAIVTMIYFAQSLRAASSKSSIEDPRQQSFGNWRRYINPAICFTLFWLFVVTLPYLGMLIGCTAFVFAAMSLLGRREPKFLLIHLMIAIISVGGMWLMFTFALDVYLPQGRLLSLL